MSGIGVEKREMLLEIWWFGFLFLFSLCLWRLCKILQTLPQQGWVPTTFYLWQQFYFLTSKCLPAPPLWFIDAKEVAYSISEIHSSLKLQHISTLRVFRRNCLEKALQEACHNDAGFRNTPTTCGESLTTLLCFVFFPDLQPSEPFGSVSKAEFMTCYPPKNNCVLSNCLVEFQLLTRRTK